MTSHDNDRGPAGQVRRPGFRIVLGLLLVLLCAACLAVQAALADRGVPAASGNAVSPGAAAGGFVLSLAATIGGQMQGGVLIETLALAVFGLGLLGASRLLRCTTRRPIAHRTVDVSQNRKVAVFARARRRASGESTTIG